MSGEVARGYNNMGDSIARVERGPNGEEIAWDPTGNRGYGYSSEPDIQAIWHENARRAIMWHNANLREAWQSYRWMMLVGVVASAVWVYCILNGDRHWGVAALMPVSVLGGQVLHFATTWGIPKRVPSPWGEEGGGHSFLEDMVYRGLPVFLRGVALAICGVLLLVPWALFSG